MAKTKYNNSPIIKKWVITICIILGIILLVLYFYKWHLVKEEGKYLNSYLISTNTINLKMNDISQISSVLSETPSYYFVYISYTKDEKIYKLEKDLKILIDDYDISNNFYFIDVTNIKEKSKNYKAEIAKELGISEDTINDIPTILYFKDGQLIKSGIKNQKEFKDLLDEENIRTM